MDKVAFHGFHWYCIVKYCSNQIQDFGKPNVGVARPADNMFLPQITSLWQRQIDGHFSFLVESKMPRESYVKYGAPQSIWTEFDVVPKTSEVHIKFQWFNKTATRLPEAHWYTFK